MFFPYVVLVVGELVEKGLMRRLPDGFDGNTCPCTFITVHLCKYYYVYGYISHAILFCLCFDLSFVCGPDIFTWSTERPNKTWAMGSGTSAFYNTAAEEDANTRMDRFYDEDRFEIYATRDIAQDEELTHTYVSLKWRTCFSDLNDIVHANKN